VQLQQELEEKVIAAVRDFADSINSGRKVVADMSSLVEVTSQLSLSNLEYWERLIRDQFSSSSRAHGPSALLTWIDLSSPDGYKREKTLRTLRGAAPNSFFFALAIRRLNDWVPQVREAARETLPLIARASDPAHVVDALFVTLSHWNSWGRIEESDKEIMLRIISSHDICESLKSKLLFTASGPLTSIFAQVGRTSVLDRYLGEIAMNATQPAVRAKAYRSQLEGKMVWIEGKKWQWTDIRYCEGRLMPILAERKIAVTSPFLEILKMASIDRSPVVRRVAAEMLIRELGNLGKESIRLANLFASDASPSVAERGNFALKKLGAE
jgi:hypothetical protein